MTLLSYDGKGAWSRVTLEKLCVAVDAGLSQCGYGKPTIDCKKSNRLYKQLDLGNWGKMAVQTAVGSGFTD